MVSLRPWQSSCVQKSLNWYANGNKHFLVNAAPGAGKTIAACVIANKLFEAGLIDSVVVIAPRRAVVDQWLNDFKTINARSMLKITAADEEPEDYGTAPALYMGEGDELEEMSSMSNGNVAGYSGSSKNKRSLIREEEPEVVEEVLNYLLSKMEIS